MVTISLRQRLRFGTPAVRPINDTAQRKVLKAEREYAVGAEVTISSLSFVPDPTRLRAMGWRVASWACMLVLVLLGFGFGPGHSHALELTDRQAAIAVSDGGEHCPGPTHTGARVHCHASSHVHSWCILLAVACPSAAVVNPVWDASPKPQFSDRAIAPIPRPSASLVA